MTQKIPKIKITIFFLLTIFPLHSGFRDVFKKLKDVTALLVSSKSEDYGITIPNEPGYKNNNYVCVEWKKGYYLKRHIIAADFLCNYLNCNSIVFALIKKQLEKDRIAGETDPHKTISKMVLYYIKLAKNLPQDEIFNCSFFTTIDPDVIVPSNFISSALNHFLQEKQSINLEQNSLTYFLKRIILRYNTMGHRGYTSMRFEREELNNKKTNLVIRELVNAAQLHPKVLSNDKDFNEYCKYKNDDIEGSPLTFSDPFSLSELITIAGIAYFEEHLAKGSYFKGVRIFNLPYIYLTTDAILKNKNLPLTITTNDDEHYTLHINVPFENSIQTILLKKCPIFSTEIEKEIWNKKTASIQKWITDSMEKKFKKTVNLPDGPATIITSFLLPPPSMLLCNKEWYDAFLQRREKLLEEE